MVQYKIAARPARRRRRALGADLAHQPRRARQEDRLPRHRPPRVDGTRGARHGGVPHACVGPPSTVGRVTRRPLGPAAGRRWSRPRSAARRSPRRRRRRAPRRPATTPATTTRRRPRTRDDARGPAAERGGPRDRPSVPAAPELAGRLPLRLRPRLPQPGRRRPHRRRPHASSSTSAPARSPTPPTPSTTPALDARDRRDGVPRHRRRPRRGRPRRGPLGPRRLAHRRLRAGAHPDPAAARLAPGRGRLLPGLPRALRRPRPARPTPPSATTRSATTRGGRRDDRGSTSSGATCRSSSRSTPTRC